MHMYLILGKLCPSLPPRGSNCLSLFNISLKQRVLSIFSFSCIFTLFSFFISLRFCRGSSGSVSLVMYVCSMLSLVTYFFSCLHASLCAELFHCFHVGFYACLFAILVNVFNYRESIITVCLFFFLIFLFFFDFLSLNFYRCRHFDTSSQLG